MKIKNLTFVLFLLINQFCIAQESTDDLTHEGFQASLFVGAGFGNTNAQTNDFGEIVFRGSRVNIRFQMGYAFNNWAAGLSYGMSSLALSSIEVENSAYGVQEGWSLDDVPIGIYVKKYIMPINIFVCADLGISKFGFFDENSKLIGNTQRGFAWNMSVGKEFAIGKKKRFGLGGYFNIAGLMCNDLPPYDRDKYSYISPGLGAVISWN